MPDAFPLPDPLPLPGCPLSHGAGEGALLGLFGSPRPPVTLTLPVADRVRVALMRACHRQVPWQISGKDERGRPRQGHAHLNVLPFASADGADTVPTIDRVLLWANAGLRDSTRAVVERLGARGGWIQLRGHARLRLELLALGPRARMVGQVPARMLGQSRSWCSATSFVAPRFPKQRRGAMLDAAREQLLWLATTVLDRAPEELTPLPARTYGWSAFAQRRIKDRVEIRRPASGWLLRFSEPLSGPITLGYGAHYGLGRFEAIDEE